MSYQVSVDNESGIVSVSVSGRASEGEHLAARDEALRLCQQDGYSSLLVDLVDLDTDGITTAGCFLFGETLAKASPRVRVAHILPKHAKSRQDVRFTSIVASNRGAIAREFDTVEEARTWLLSSTRNGSTLLPRSKNR